jgi:hypothetical protein
MVEIHNAIGTRHLTLHYKLRGEEIEIPVEISGDFEEFSIKRREEELNQRRKPQGGAQRRGKIPRRTYFP